MNCSFKAVLSNDFLLDFLISTWNETLSNSFGYGHMSATEQEEITKKINYFYFGSEATPTNQLDRNNLIDVMRCSIYITIFFKLDF